MRQSERFATVLMLDIMNSSEYANVLSVKEYYENFLKEFNETVLRATELYFRYEPTNNYNESNYYVEVVGDEGRVFLFSDDSGRDVQTALDLAIIIKIAWFTGRFNRSRISQNKPPEDLGIGINSGYLYRKDNGKLEGFGINLTKRIESYSRFGSFSKIMLHKTSRSILDKFVSEKEVGMCLKLDETEILLPQHYFFSFSGNIELKGIAQPIPVYELQYINWGELPFFMEGAFIEKLALMSPDEFYSALETGLSLSVLDTMINNILLYISIMNENWMQVAQISKTLYEGLDHIMEIPLVAAIANIILFSSEVPSRKNFVSHSRKWLDIAKKIRPHAGQIDILEKILCGCKE